jgi:ribose transport system ATP-binding protein
MLSIQGVSKSYGRARVLEDVSLEVPGGSVHALLGSNGAGKSTLMKCIAGAVAPDRGVISIGGVLSTSFNPQVSRRLGVASVFQHLSLISTLTVAENIFLGDELTRWGFVTRRAQNREASKVLKELGEDIDPVVRVEDLRADQRQMVEIAKAVAKSPKVLILDEPTAALSYSETDRLFSVIRDLKRLGIAVIYISHRIQEIFDIADNLTVLRDGSVVLQTSVAAATQKQLISAIAGEKLALQNSKVGGRILDDVALAATNLCCGLPDPISLKVRKGEIVGVYGLKGNGRQTLVAALAGAIKSSGGLWVNGTLRHFADPAEAIASGICLVPGDRLKRGVFSRLSAFDNVLLPHMADFGVGPFRSRRREHGIFKKIADALRVTPSDPQMRTGTLSGGNQQKLLLGRWISRPAKLNALLLEEPTEGVDAGARRDLYNNLRLATETHGFGVLWSSSDLDELVEMADRVLVMAGGRIVKELSGSDITPPSILAAAQAN